MPLNEIRQARLEKLNKLQKAGVDPYPAKSWRTHEIKSVLADFDNLAADKRAFVLVGRIMARREHGGSAFFDIQDESGKIQIFLKKDVLGDKNFEFFMETTDVGDFIEINGALFRTKQNEPTLQVEKYRMLAKSLLPLPEKWHGLQDVEERFRKRYLDLIFNPNVKKKIVTRANIIEFIRQYLIKDDFIEVETPVLQTLAGGANARPFITHLNALDIDLFLRIAPELYLKRLLIGCFEKVFEFARNFRNEGMDREHHPEFTMLEFYAAYWDYEKMMTFVEGLLAGVVKKLFGSSKTKIQAGEVDFKGPYPRVTFNDLFQKNSGLNYDETDEATLAKKARELKITIEKTMTKGNIADEIYKKVARPKIIQPTYVINHPLDISPLSKKLDKDPEHVARFQLIVGGMEVTNGFSELNDPIDQKERLFEQERNVKKGNKEAHQFDADYIEAMEYGMPPAAGIGIGIDRLVALLTNSHSIREVILFPLMKPK